jgi:hypothetical protein
MARLIAWLCRRFSPVEEPAWDVVIDGQDPSIGGIDRTPVTWWKNPHV